MVNLELLIKTKKAKEIIDITDEVKSLTNQNKFKNGLCHLFITHTTAALTTADLDPGTDLDFLDFLEKIKPSINYRHPHNPAHAPDHILSSIIGASLVIPVQDSRLVLGTWQRIVLIELDGPRSRTVIINFQ
jgi:secondary thiamine-phosphate synthase enzyme